jgi:hypothetical protein
MPAAEPSADALERTSDGQYRAIAVRHARDVKPRDRAIAARSPKCLRGIPEMCHQVPRRKQVASLDYESAFHPVRDEAASERHCYVCFDRPRPRPRSRYLRYKHSTGCSSVHAFSRRGNAFASIDGQHSITEDEGRRRGRGRLERVAMNITNWEPLSRENLGIGHPRRLAGGLKYRPPDVTLRVDFSPASDDNIKWNMDKSIVPATD